MNIYLIERGGVTTRIEALNARSAPYSDDILDRDLEPGESTTITRLPDPSLDVTVTLTADELAVLVALAQNQSPYLMHRPLTAAGQDVLSVVRARLVGQAAPVHENARAIGHYAISRGLVLGS